MIRRLTVLLAALLVLPAAWAQKTPPPPSFEQLDANKDGRISVSEARKDKTIAARFAAGDTNQDGYLDRAEFEAIRLPK